MMVSYFKCEIGEMAESDGGAERGRWHDFSNRTGLYVVTSSDYKNLEIGIF